MIDSVCIITRAETWGGVEKHTLGLIKYLLSRNVKIELISSGHNLYSNYLDESAHLKLYSTNLDVYDKGTSSDVLWNSFFKKIKSRIVILPKGGPYWGSFAFLKACRRKFSRVIYIEHGLVPLPPKNLLAFFKGLKWGHWKWWYADFFVKGKRARYADKVIAVSQEVKNALIKYNKYPDNKIVVVENGIDWWNFSRDEALGYEFRKVYQLALNTIILGMVTRLDYIKGVDIAIAAFNSALKNIGKEIQLVIVGDGPEKESLQRLVNDFKLDQRVRFVGFQINPLSAYSAIDVLIMPSRSESFGLTLLEGLTAGCIPIVSNVGGMPSIINFTECGLIVQTDDIKALADAIVRITQDLSEKRTSMQIKAMERITQRYDINKKYDDILSLMNEIITNA